MCYVPIEVSGELEHAEVMQKIGVILYPVSQTFLTSCATEQIRRNERGPASDAVSRVFFNRSMQS